MSISHYNEDGPTYILNRISSSYFMLVVVCCVSVNISCKVLVTSHFHQSNPFVTDNNNNNNNTNTTTTTTFNNNNSNNKHAYGMQIYLRAVRII